MQASGSLIAVACALAVLPLAAAHAAATEEDELALAFGDKATVTVATGSRQSLRRAPAVATVITAADIATMGAVDLDEVLETVPGIHVSYNNQSYNPLYVVRGLYSEFNPQTLVLLNGVPLTTLFVGNRGLGWGGMPVENIARIEVIRGPGSALYGADAFAGVISIVTKDAEQISGLEVGARGGSFKTWNGWMQYGGKLGAVDVSGYLRVGSSDGFQRTVDSDLQSQLDKLFGTQASLAPGPVQTGYDALDGNIELGWGKLRLRASYKLRDKLGAGAGVAGVLDPVGAFLTKRGTVDLSWRDIELSPDWRLNLTASHLYYNQNFDKPLQLFPPGAFGGAFPNGMIGAPQTWERQLRLAAVAQYSGIAQHAIRVGVGHDDLNLYRTRELKNFSFITSGPATGAPMPTPGAGVLVFPVAQSFLEPHDRRVDYLYLQDEWSLARDWTLTAGIRHDRYSDFGDTTNPRLALVWDASIDLTAKLLYGQAFRAPAFTELYSINNPVYRGNPSLKPETIRTLEAAMAWQAQPNLEVNLSLYRYRMKDIIRTTDGGNNTVVFDNIGALRGHGFELESTWDASRRLRLSGHLAWQRSIDEVSGQDAGYAPHRHLFGRADWSLAGGWVLSGQANHVADRRRPAGDNRPRVPDYTTLDLTLRTGRLSSRWELTASVRNLFNADVREPSLATSSIAQDLPMAPRSLYLQAAYRL